jgi:hypothetical protein
MNAFPEKETFTVVIHHYRTYWTNPPVEIELSFQADYSAILDKVSRYFEPPVHYLYTSDKLSQITSTAVLATKSRVIAASDKDKIRKEECGPLIHPNFLGVEQSELFGNDGGTLSDFEHAALVIVPQGAIEQGYKVKVKLRAAAPDRRMDLSNNWGQVLPVGLPVVLEINPICHGFKKSVKLRLPHCGVYEQNSHNIVVLAAKTDMPMTSQLVFDRLPIDQLEVTDYYVTISIQSAVISWFWVFTESDVRSRHCAAAIYTLSDEAARQTQDSIDIKMAIFPNLHMYYMVRLSLSLSTADSITRPK